jgi:hypothetical protein
MRGVLNRRLDRKRIRRRVSGEESSKQCSIERRERVAQEVERLRIEAMVTQEAELRQIEQEQAAQDQPQIGMGEDEVEM